MELPLLTKLAGKLSTKARNNLPAGDFALSKRRYPIEDKKHERAALQRVSQFGTSAEKSKVRAAVHAKDPSMEINKEAAYNFGALLALKQTGI
jgi:hypothetical protein